MHALTKGQGVFELTLLNAEHAKIQFDDVLVDGLALGIPAEILTRLEQVWVATKTIAGEVVAVGKIIVAKILDFLKANLHITVGVALGAAVGALTAAIPFVGPLLAPIVTGMAVLYGAAKGAAIDAGAPSNDLLTAATQLAKKFFELLQSIFSAVEEYWLAN